MPCSSCPKYRPGNCASGLRPEGLRLMILHFSPHISLDHAPPFLSRGVSVMYQPLPLAATVTVTVFVKIPVRSCGIAAAAGASNAAADGAKRKQFVHTTSSSLSAPSLPLVFLQRHPTVTPRPNIRTSTPPLHSSLPRVRSRWFVRGTCTIGAVPRTSRASGYPSSPPPSNPFSLRLRVCQTNPSASYHHDFCWRIEKRYVLICPFSHRDEGALCVRLIHPIMHLHRTHHFVNLIISPPSFIAHRYLAPNRLIFCSATFPSSPCLYTYLFTLASWNRNGHKKA
jgi:hypothetical protein